MNSDASQREIAEEGLEPSIRAYETRVIPFHYSAILDGSGWDRTSDHSLKSTLFFH